MVNPYVPWASQDTQWHGQSGPSIACASPTELAVACGGQVGMDFGGNPTGADGTACGFAPVVAIYADHADWQAPGWYGGPVLVDAGMSSPADCQAACLLADGCDFFSYEWELTAGAMYHECYLKEDYDTANCAGRYVPWASEDAQWHGQSGPKMCDTQVAVTTTTYDAAQLSAAQTTVTAAFVDTAVDTVVIAADATFDVDFASINVDNFKAEFVTSMGAALGFGNVIVDSVASGSVVVSWHVLAPASVANEAASIVVSATPPTVSGATATVSAPVVTAGPPTALAGDDAVGSVEDNSADCVVTYACDSDCVAQATTVTAQAGAGAACAAAPSCSPGDDDCPAPPPPPAVPAPAPAPASGAATTAVAIVMLATSVAMLV